MRRATVFVRPDEQAVLISIHALHEESDWGDSDNTNAVHISIHALHEESDMAVHARHTRVLLISIHALHEESDSRWY